MASARELLQTDKAFLCETQLRMDYLLLLETGDLGRTGSLYKFGIVYYVHIKSPQGTKDDQTITVKPLH